MKVTNTTIFMGDDTLRARHGQMQFDNKTQGGSIDASSLRTKFDPIAVKKEESQKKAMKIVGDAFKNDLKIDDDLNARRAKIDSLRKDRHDAKMAIKDIEDDRAALRDVYGIEEDSQEEKDLKLLEKEVKSKMPGSDIHLTKDDREAISKIKEKGLSEYQQRSIEMLEYEVPYAVTAYEAEQEIMVENQIISATELERLKSHALVDAQKQAEAIMDEASREIVGMVADEAKDHIDEENEERKEKAKAEEEKQEELEARIDAAREKRKENEELTEDILEGVQETTSVSKDMNAARQEIKEMMSKMKLIEDDIKGAAVDTSL
ncbi:MAG: hypothetical protein MJ123_11680 [Lachnospiraceae bacterium]|nr:hypothetical protein [Lachnospiraceae bacterium]